MKRAARKKAPLQEAASAAIGRTADTYSAPERELLARVLCNEDVVDRLSRAPGGWRTLSPHELAFLNLEEDERRRVLALQELVSRGYPALPDGRLDCSLDVGRVYAARLGGLVHEVMLVVAVDGQNHFRGEATVAVGGAHGLSITAREVLRPLVRMGASGGILLHNHPSGNPSPSAEDVAMTRAVAQAAHVVGVPIIDHIVVARGGRYASLLDLGLFDPTERYR